MKIFTKKIVTKSLAIVLSVVFLNGCATKWKSQGVFNKTVQTKLSVKTEPVGDVYINGTYFGKTPLSVPLDYSQEVEKRTRKVCNWKDSPGGALLLSVIMPIICLPLTLLPLTDETVSVALDKYKSNQFSLKVEARDYLPFMKELICTGEKEIQVEEKLVLEKESM